MKKIMNRLRKMAVLLTASLLCMGSASVYGGNLDAPAVLSSADAENIVAQNEDLEQSLSAEQTEGEAPENAEEDLADAPDVEPEAFSQAKEEPTDAPNMELESEPEEKASQAEPIAASLAYVLRQTGDYILAADPEPDQNSQWNVIGLARSGLLPDAYKEKFYENTAAYVQENKGVLHRVKYTEYSKMALSMTAIGKDARNVAGYDLLEKLADFEKVKGQGFNGPIWALIAFHAHPDYQIPVVSGVAEQTTEEGLIAYLLEKEIPGGGWSLYGGVAEEDITSMTLQALAPYYSKHS